MFFLQFWNGTEVKIKQPKKTNKEFNQSKNLRYTRLIASALLHINIFNENNWFMLLQMQLQGKGLKDYHYFLLIQK